MGTYDRNFKNMLTGNLGFDNLLNTDPPQSTPTPSLNTQPNQDAQTAALIGTGELSAQDNSSVQE